MLGIVTFCAFTLALSKGEQDVTERVYALEHCLSGPLVNLCVPRGDLVFTKVNNSTKLSMRSHADYTEGRSEIRKQLKSCASCWLSLQVNGGSIVASSPPVLDSDHWTDTLWIHLGLDADLVGLSYRVDPSSRDGRLRLGLSEATEVPPPLISSQKRLAADQKAYAAARKAGRELDMDKLKLEGVLDDLKEQPAEEQQSFVRRYWWLFLGLLVIQLLGSTADQGGGGGGGK